MSYKKGDLNLAYEPISLCALNRRVDAVYRCDEGIQRVPVLALAIARELTVVSKTGSIIGRERILVHVEADGSYLALSPETDYQEDLIGYEYDGVQQDWTEEIQRKMEMEKYMDETKGVQP